MKKKCKYIPIENSISLDKIHNLFINNIEEEPNTSLENFYFGLYFKNKKKYDKMLNYYSKATALGSEDAMVNLGSYFKKTKDYDNMMKYYLMATEKGNVLAMANIAKYYKEQKDISNMTKYLELGVKEGDSKSMCRLAKYYKGAKDYDKMMELYKKAINPPCSSPRAMRFLASYYRSVGNYSKMEKYYKMSSEYGNSQAMYLLSNYYSSKNDTFNSNYYLELAVKNGHKNAQQKLIKVYEDQKNYEKLFQIYFNHIKDNQIAFDYLNKLLITTHLDSLEEETLDYIYNFDIKQFENVPLFVKVIKELLNKQEGLVDIDDIRLEIEI